jgi:hypothetical protein
MMKLYKERSDKLIKRRQEDVKDQSLEYMPGRYIAYIGIYNYHSCSLQPFFCLLGRFCW